MSGGKHGNLGLVGGILVTGLAAEFRHGCSMAGG